MPRHDKCKRENIRHNSGQILKIKCGRNALTTTIALQSDEIRQAHT